jgi:4a-hydroxytetrahydrobiopterin dehydratase
MGLADLTCKSPKSGDVPLSPEQVERMIAEISGWTLTFSSISREFQFKSFVEAMAFVNNIAALALEQDHHPDIFISYKTVRLTFSTHRIGGLSQNDFIMAAKVDRLMPGMPSAK